MRRSSSGVIVELFFDESEEGPLVVLQKPEMTFQLETLGVGGGSFKASASLGFPAVEVLDLVLQLGDVHG